MLFTILQLVVKIINMSEEYFEQFPSPCYIMFEEALEANLQLLDLVQREADVSIICALKVFFWHSFPLIKHYLRAAASSVNEARLIGRWVVKLILIRRLRMRSLSIIISNSPILYIWMIWDRVWHFS